MCVASFTSSGALDTSFGGGTGYTLLNVASGGEAVRAIALQGDGRIVLAGHCAVAFASSLDDFCLARLNADGSVDTSFGVAGSGWIVSNLGGGTNRQRANALAIRPDGKYMLAGQCEIGGSDRFCIAQYEANGATLDLSFGAGAGYITHSLSATYPSRALGMVVQPNGRLLLLGACGSDSCTARYLPTGVVDTSYGTNGVEGTAGTTGYVPTTAGLAQAVDGSIVAGSFWNPGAGFDGSRLRLLSPDGSFVASYLGAPSYIASAAQGWAGLAIQRDGKIVAAMSTADLANASTGNFRVVRVHGFDYQGRNCSLDVDGDGLVTPMSDALIHARVAVGMRGSAVTNGIDFAPHASRNTWASIRQYLVSHCGMTIAP